jgi:hypothetical protein
MVFLDYDKVTKGYRCLDSTTRKIVISRDVKFVENQVGIPNMQEKPSNLDTILKTFLDQNQVPTVATETQTKPNTNGQPLPSQFLDLANTAHSALSPTPLSLDYSIHS